MAGQRRRLPAAVLALAAAVLAKEGAAIVPALFADEGDAWRRQFGAAGAKLLLGARRLDRLQQTAEQALKAGAAEAHTRTLDVGQTGSVNAFIDWANLRCTVPTRSTPWPQSRRIDASGASVGAWATGCW